MSFVMTRVRALLPLLGLLVLSAPALAHSYKAGSLEIGHPWSRETAPGAAVGAGYFKVTNTGSESDKLTGVETPGAEKVEMHESTNENGVAKMRMVNAIEIPPGETALKPGGYHLMLMGLKEALAEGMRVPAVLIFEKAGRVEVELAVENMGYGGGHDQGGHKH
jgi:copper(I)-binding protein